MRPRPEAGGSWRWAPPAPGSWSTAPRLRALQAQKGWCDLYLYPGYRFKAVDRLITNFHLPKSTLLLLVSALAGRDLILRAYAEAVKEQVPLLQLWGLHVDFVTALIT